MKHEKVVCEWYEVSFSASHRTLGPKIDEFLEGYPSLDKDKDVASEIFSDNHTILRDYEGDFEGVEIYSCEAMQPVIRFICEKLDLDYKNHSHLNFKLVG